MVVARTPRVWGGYIQSLKWSASNFPIHRSAGGYPSIDHAVVYAIALVGQPWSGRSFRGLTGDLLKQQVTLAPVAA